MALSARGGSGTSRDWIETVAMVAAYGKQRRLRRGIEQGVNRKK